MKRLAAPKKVSITPATPNFVAVVQGKYQGFEFSDFAGGVAA
jgi:hypothetical protein